LPGGHLPAWVIITERILSSDKTLPFFKQFSAGGPYSMRAWGLRQLGMGSSIQSDTISTTNYRDRFGDMQLEANVEYRFPLATVAGIKVASALFADMGNVWNVKTDLRSERTVRIQPISYAISPLA
jgi:outer membrane protein assembly factor BamA